MTKVKDTLALQTEESGDLDFLTSSEHFVNLRFDTSDLEIAPHCTLHYCTTESARNASQVLKWQPCHLCLALSASGLRCLNNS